MVLHIHTMIHCSASLAFSLALFDSVPRRPRSPRSIHGTASPEVAIVDSDAERNAFAIRSSRIRPWLSERSSSLPRRRSTWRSAMACLFRRRSDDKARLSAIRSWHTSSAPAEVRTPRLTSSATRTRASSPRGRQQRECRIRRRTQNRAGGRGFQAPRGA